jgi:hypothetical protein
LVLKSSKLVYACVSRDRKRKSLPVTTSGEPVSQPHPGDEPRPAQPVNIRQPAQAIVTCNYFINGIPIWTSSVPAFLRRFCLEFLLLRLYAQQSAALPLIDTRALKVIP